MAQLCSLSATPDQIVFGREYGFALTVSWDDLETKKRKRRQANNDHENRKRNKCDFKVGDEVMLER